MDKMTANYVLDETFPESAKKVLHKKNESYRGLIMKFFVQGPEPRATRDLVKKIQAEMNRLGFNELEGITYRIGGGDIALHIEEGYYFSNFIQSFFLSLLINFIVLLIVWRRFWQPLLAVIPLILSVGLTTGLLPLLDIKLKPHFLRLRF